MDPHDDELVALAKSGDPESWRALYRAHAGRLVVWLAARGTGDPAVSAEDLAAEAWLVAAERVGAFRGTSDDFAGWLFGIARNLGLNLHRRSGRRRTFPTGEPTLLDQAVSGPEAVLGEKDWVRHVLATLSPRERDVVGCLDVVGLDIESTARALGISAASVRVSHHRGLRRLRGAAGTPLRLVP